MKLLVRLSASLLLLNGLLRPAVAQILPPTPTDTATLRKLVLERRNTVAVFTPTVVVLTPDSVALSSADAGNLDSIVGRFGFQLVARPWRRLALVDKRYNAVYYLPPDVRAGYVILGPGKRPDLVRAPASDDALTQRLLAYGRRVGP